MKENLLHYRSEIDGLRALAVIPVLLFHSGIDFFKGGYIGVDVFFVISGFLITNIILLDIEKGAFRLSIFYERRIRRIFPALIFVVIASIPFAWYILLPPDYRDFSQSLVAVVTFTSNILFWHEVGYFETQAELKPLLHTWSLAIEEQFYIIYPIILLFLYRYKKSIIIIISILIIILLLSFISCLETNSQNSRLSFFFLHTRAWELIMGSLLSFNMKYQFIKNYSFKINQIFSFFGLSLILFSIFIFDDTTTFPGWSTLLPTFGTLLILNFAVDNTITKKILQTGFLVNIGLISYSAYLWHFPIMAFTKYFWVTELSDQIKYIMFISIFPIAFLSWKFIETPFRNHEKIKTNFLITLTIILVGIIFSIGVLGHINNGYQNRTPPANLHKSFYKDLTNNQITTIFKGTNGKLCSSSSPSMCKVNNSENKKILLIGDSHSADFSYYYKKYSILNNLDAWQMSSLGCNFTFQEFNTKQNCKDSYWFLKEVLSNKKFDIIIFVSSTNNNVNKDQFFKDFLISLKTKNNNVIYFTPRPSFNISIPHAIKLNRTADVKEKKNNDNLELSSFLLKNEIKIFDQKKIIFDHFCFKINKCKDDIFKIRSLYRDNNHLSDFGAKFVFQKFTNSKFIDLK